MKRQAKGGMVAEGAWLENRISDDFGEQEQQQQQRSNVARGRVEITTTAPPRAAQRRQVELRDEVQSARESPWPDPLPGVGRRIPAQMGTQDKDSPVRRRGPLTGSARRLRERVILPSVEREIPAQIGTQHRGSIDTCGVSGIDARQSVAAPSAATTSRRTAPHTRGIQSEEWESEARDERLAGKFKSTSNNTRAM